MADEQGSMEDDLDALPISGLKISAPVVKVPSEYSFSNDIYPMKNKTRGMAIIFNNYKFSARLGLSIRNGSVEDAVRLYEVFSTLQFRVQVKDNFTSEKMINLASDVAEMNHSDYDCFIMCVLTHGDENGIYSFDGKITLDDLSEPFKGDKCRSLAAKPKLFFIQACQGSKLDHGVDMELADAACFQRIPIEADCLFAHSSVPGYYSWRHQKQGSWFIQALCEELETNKSMDLLRILTRVNRKVAYQKESFVPNSSMDRCKQMPFFKSMLTREVYFYEDPTQLCTRV